MFDGAERIRDIGVNLADVAIDIEHRLVFSCHAEDVIQRYG